ncbi:hypothetical protein F444_12256, partial [Phytophthora nicotianae P1976]
RETGTRAERTESSSASWTQTSDGVSSKKQFSAVLSRR